MFIGKTITWFLRNRYEAIKHFVANPIEVQQKLLFELLKTAKDTEIGKQYDFAQINTYQQFANTIPIVSYEIIEPLIERVRLGEQNLFWPTKIKWFAKSSGTTNAKSKFIPISQESLDICHIKGGKDMLTLYAVNNPTSQIFQSKNFRLGGSQEIHQSGKSYFGDLSAIIINNTPTWADIKSTPTRKIALMSNWEKKLDAIAQQVVNQKVSSLAGVPSWMMITLQHILKHTQKATINEIWNELEVFFHGGISFMPYAESYRNLIGKDINYYEVYNASEGYFAVQDTNYSKEMLLMLNHGVFYEFIPMKHFHEENPVAIPLESVNLDENYALVITTNGGLWRYIIGDTIKFTSLQPYRIVITGRTKHYINAFGEELMIDNAQKALQEACNATQARLIEFTAAPIYMVDNQSGAHEWLIEFVQLPNDLKLFQTTLDESLKKLNSDYEAKRFNNMTLNQPVIQVARAGLFYDWMKSKGKLGGQNKVPKLANTREYIEPLLKNNT